MKLNTATQSLIGVIFVLLNTVSGFGTPAIERKNFIQASAAAVAGSLLSGGLVSPSPALAADPPKDKQLNLPDDQLKEIIRRDVVENQYLCNGKLTRSVYDEG